MPTHPLIPYVESPDGLAQDILSHNGASMPGTGSSMTPHASLLEKSESSALPVDCMFCEQTFQQQEDLGPHLLSQHPTTLFGPAVLRVEAQFLTPAERARSKTPSQPTLPQDDELSCEVCGQAAADAAELEVHMRKHKDSFIYCCGLCGRRFKEPWFLKNHMRTHGGKSGTKNKALQDLETPVTINDIVQDRPPSPVVTPHKMCMVCGFLFSSKEVLAEHSKVHNREPEVNEEEDVHANPQSAVDAPPSQEAFFQFLMLRPTSEETTQMAKSARWISQLDPFNTYQAWQLATKGKIASGPNLAKELNPDSTSDNEDSCSDKEELGAIWSSNGGDKPDKEGLGSEMKPKRSGSDTPMPMPEQKSLMRSEKPTHCRECGKSFRTYHQLVLHSRVHKRERGGADSPTTPGDGKAQNASPADGIALERAEECSEDGSEEGAPVDAFHSDKSEDGFGKMKLKILAPRECSYCGKTFRSNYYLNIHLRTHTGEKPYKCEYCDYAAAQKTSLRYHLDRRHKDKPYTEIPNIPVTSAPSPTEGKGRESPRSMEDKPVSNPAKRWLTPKSDLGSRASVSTKPDPDVSQLVCNSDSPLPAVKPELCTAPVSEEHLKCPLPMNLKTEVKDILEVPLNLSLKVSVSVSATSMPRSLLLTNSCTSCSYETLYPEVLLMHKKLVHKEKLDVKRNGLRNSAKQQRHTGCPPALEGKDVTPLPPLNRKLPRRTKSPPPQPDKAEPAQTSSQPQMPKQSPAREPWRRDHHSDAQRGRTAAPTNTCPSKQPQPRLSDPAPEPGRKQGPAAASDRNGSGQRPGLVRKGAVWNSDTARLCLSSRLGGLVPPDFGEPSSKRLKSSDSQEQLRGVLAGNYSRLLPSGRGEKTPSQHSPSVTSANAATGTASNNSSNSSNSNSNSSSSSSSSLEQDWNVINLLRSYTPSDLASLYHSRVAGAGHAAMPTPVTGNRPVLYPNFSSSLSQRRAHGSHMGSGPTEKSS